MLNAVKSVLADVSSVSPLSEQRALGIVDKQVEFQKISKCEFICHVKFVFYRIHICEKSVCF